MRRPLPIAVAQPSCISHDVAANAVTHAAVVRSAGTRVVVFPELSLTGYELDTTPIGVDDPRLAPLVTACAETGTVALAGAPTRDGPHLAILAVDGSGVTVAYRKMWLAPAEAERFAPGSEPVVYEVDGWRLGLAICKDTGVPQHAADTAALGVDAYVAGVLEHADGDDVPDTRARRVAVDHQVWVAVASFAGSTGGGYHDAAGRSGVWAAGRSGVWAAGGAVVAQAGRETGAIARASLGSVPAHRPADSPR